MHQVGAGVLGPVFRAYDPDGDRTVALKSFALDITPEQARDFAADLQRLAALELNHPSLIAPWHAGVEGSTAYLVEEYFVADSIDTAIRQYGPAPVADALRLVGHLAGALDFAAAAGVHHGALHPRDVLVAPREVRMTGIGVAEALERSGFRAAARRPYGAPERVEGGEPTIAADLYSLAVITHELLTGRRPTLAGETLQADVQAITAAEPAALAEVFARAFAVLPEDRYPAALAFAGALKHALTGQPIDAPAEAERPRPRRGARAAASKQVAVPVESVVPVEEERAVRESPRKVEREPASAPATPETEPSAAREPEAVAAPEPAAPLAPLRDGMSARDADGGAERDADGRAAPDAEDVPPPATLLPDEPEVVREAMLVAEPELPAPPPIELDSLDLRVEEPEPFELRPRTEPEANAPAGAPPPAPPDVRPAAPRFTPPRPGARYQPALRQKRRLSGGALLVMLVFGVLLGLSLGYYFAARRSPAVAPEADASSQAPAAPAVPTPSLPSDLGQGSPAAAPSKPATDVPPTTGGGQAAGAAPAGGASATPGAPGGGAAAGAAAGEKPRDSARPPAAPKRATPGDTPARPARSSRAGEARSKSAAGGAAGGAERTRRPVFEGPLSIVSKPAGARVFFDGHPVGTTPITLSKVSAGSHVVRLEREGYTTWSSSVQVVAGEQNRVTASLEQQRLRSR